jgi:hypothetical protein
LWALLKYEEAGLRVKVNIISNCNGRSSFRTREGNYPITMVLCNSEEPLVKPKMCLWDYGLNCFWFLQLFTGPTALHPNAIFFHFGSLERPVNSRNHCFFRSNRSPVLVTAFPSNVALFKCQSALHSACRCTFPILNHSCIHNAAAGATNSYWQ